MGSTLQVVDWIAIAVYFCILGGVVWWVVKSGKDEAADYFLAGRNLSWWIIGASIFASNIGSEHVVGLAGSGATSGVAMAHYELHAWCLLVLGWVFVPFYMRSKVFTSETWNFCERITRPLMNQNTAPSAFTGRISITSKPAASRRILSRAGVYRR